jgi:hypothetical protein
VSASAWELETILLHPEYPMKLSDREGQVMNATKPDFATGSVTLARKEEAAWETTKVLFSTIPMSSDLHDQCILHRFLVLPLLSSISGRDFF